MAARLKERYEREIKLQLMERFGYKSPMQVPRLEKITLNMGIGEAKMNTALLDAASDQLSVIAGQRPSVRRARKSIANFKLRAGMPVGLKVTLRHQRMYEMLDRLQSVAIPRIRDFRGLNPRAFDGRGNYSMGIREQIIFPEIDYDAIDQVRGLEVTITTSAPTDEEAYELLRLLGMPFRSPDGGQRPERAQASEAPATAVQEEPAAEEAAEEPGAEEPAAEEPGAEQGVQEPSAGEQAAEEPAPEGPMPEEPASGESAEPAGDQPDTNVSETEER